MYAINMNDGTISVYVPGVTNCCFAQIPDNVAKAVWDKKVTWQAVVNAINKKRYFDKDFDWTKLREDQDKLNMRRGEFGFVKEGETAQVEEKGRDSELVTLKDVKGEVGDALSDITHANEARTASTVPGGEAAVPPLQEHDDGAPGTIK